MHERIKHPSQAYLVQNIQKGLIVNLAHLQSQKIRVEFGRLDLDVSVFGLQLQGEIVFGAGADVAL